MVVEEVEGVVEDTEEEADTEATEEEEDGEDTEGTGEEEEDGEDMAAMVMVVILIECEVILMMVGDLMIGVHSRDSDHFPMSSLII